MIAKFFRRRCTMMRRVCKRNLATTTHEVTNQATTLENYDALSHDRALATRANVMLSPDQKEEVARYGTILGAPVFLEHADRANRNIPELKTHDRFGHRIDSVVYDPSYHHIMNRAVSAGVSNLCWRESFRREAGSHLSRAFLSMLHYQHESGTGCPLTMAFASVPCLRTGAKHSDFIRELLDKVSQSSEYDPSDVPIHQKNGCLVGMSMTEKQGGSDVRTNTTVASPIRGEGTEFELVGHKWFTSAPMSDGFLTLAKVSGSDDLTCFLVPRWRPDTQQRNVGFRLQRLKSKLGDRSNASSEVEYDRAYGILIGEVDRGVSCIIEMVSLTRLDCVLGSAALQRHATNHALHHANHRRAFGALLRSQPLMSSVLTDLCVESEAAISLALRLARASEAHYRSNDTEERDFFRLACAVAKYYICKRTPAVVAEALECFGGNGFVEDHGNMMPRLYRQAPLNSIWEGSSNVICLDVLRAMKRNPESTRALRSELETFRGNDSRYDRLLDRIWSSLAALGERDGIFGVRAFVDDLAVALCACSLMNDLERGIPCNDVLEFYVSSRVDGAYGTNLGSLRNPDAASAKRVVDQAAEFLARR